MLMFYKGLDPLLVQMTAYYRRKDARQLGAGRLAVQQSMARAAKPTERLAGLSSTDELG